MAVITTWGAILENDGSDHYLGSDIRESDHYLGSDIRECLWQ